MSQETVRKLLVELGGEATERELIEFAREKFPSRTLDTYLTDRLKQMEKKELVNNEHKTWILTKKGRNTQIEHKISEIDTKVREEALSLSSLTITNLVATYQLEQQLDLESLSTKLDNTDYHPETTPNLIYTPPDYDNIRILTPSSGRLTITGARTKTELIDGIEFYFDDLERMGISINGQGTDLVIQNIVSRLDLDRELDLSAISIALGLERVEYEPEQFPGIIYRGTRNSTILLFNSGKCVITGARTYLETVNARDEIIEILSSIGVDLDVESDLAGQINETT